MGNNIGATLLDVQQGMEYQKGIQRKDAEWERNQKRANMQDQVAQYGLEDLQQTRGDKAARRTAAAGAVDLESATQAEKSAALARGDVAGATAANESRLKALVTDFQTTAAQFEKKQQPIKQGLEATALAGQVARQPATEAIAGQNVADQSMAAREKLLARFYQIAQVDVNAAKQLLSDSPILFPGQKVADIMVSKDGQRVAIVGEDGQPLTMLNKPFMEQLAQKYGDPGKVYEVEAGKRLVHATAGGKAKEIYAAPAADVAGKFTETKDGGILDTRRGTVTPAAGGPRPPDAAKRDARVKTADSIVRESLGGSLNMGLPSEDAQKAYPMIMERVGKKIDAGVPPEKAARDAMEEVKREAKPDAPAGPVNWQDFANRPFPAPRAAKPAGPNLGGSVMNGYGLDSATPEVPSVFP